MNVVILVVFSPGGRSIGGEVVNTSGGLPLFTTNGGMAGKMMPPTTSTIYHMGTLSKVNLFRTWSMTPHHMFFLLLRTFTCVILLILG